MPFLQSCTLARLTCSELDNHYMKFHADKAQRILDRGAKCCYTDPSAYDGAVELLEELCGYLPERYPSLYQRTPVGIDNLLTRESFNIVERPLVEDPMQMSARLVQDDLAIMFEKEDGQYYLLAGAILLAGFWKLEDKLGMPLSEIHTSGDVPGFKEKLEKGMMNFFRRVQPNGPVQRVRINSSEMSSNAREYALANVYRTTISSKSMMNSRGPPASGPKMARKEQSAGLPPKRTRLSHTTISALSVRHYVACRGVEVLCLRSARTSIPLRRSARSRMCRDAWRARLGVGEVMLVGTRAKNGTRRYCWNIWIRSIRSRLRRGWRLRRRMKLGRILIKVRFGRWGIYGNADSTGILAGEKCMQLKCKIPSSKSIGSFSKCWLLYSPAILILRCRLYSRLRFALLSFPTHHRLILLSKQLYSCL